jgi:hypothetical protein
MRWARFGLVGAVLMAGSVLANVAPAAAANPVDASPWRVTKLGVAPVLPSAVPGAPIGSGLVASSEMVAGDDVNNDGDRSDELLAWFDPTADRGPYVVGAVLNKDAPLMNGVFVVASERSGVDLNRDGDTVDSGYFWVSGSGSFVFAGSGKPNTTTGSALQAVFGNGVGVVVLESEVDRGMDLDDDGGVDVLDYDIVLLRSGGLAAERTHIQTVPNNVARFFVALGDGAVGGGSLVLADGRVRWFGMLVNVVGHQGDAAFFLTGTNYMRLDELMIALPGQDPVRTIGGGRVYQVDSDVWLETAETGAGIDVDSNGFVDAATGVLCRVLALPVSLALTEKPPLACVGVRAPFGQVSSTGGGYLLLHGSRTGVFASQGMKTFLIGPAGIVATLDPSLPYVLGDGSIGLVITGSPQGTDLYPSYSFRTVRAGTFGPVIWERRTMSDGPSISPLGDGRALVRIPEGVPNDSAVDLNDNGTFGDVVAHLYADGVLTNLKTSIDATYLYSYSRFSYKVLRPRGPILLSVSEASPKRDLNGDGDTIDLVLQVIEGTTMTNLGLALFHDANRALPQLGEVGIDKVAVTIAESDQGVDFDGDGVLEEFSYETFLVGRAGVEPSSGPTSGFLQSSRVLDTRVGGQVGYVGAKPVAGQTLEVQIAGVGGVPATGVRSVALNVTVTDATAPGFVTVWGDGARPDTSNVNIERAGQTVPNLVVVPVGADGKVRLFTDGGAHLLADTAAWWGDGSGLQSMKPSRLLDTRNGSKPARGSVTDVQVAGRGGAPASGSMVAVLNVTVTAASGPGFVTVWGDGSRPDTSNLNAAETGQTIANLVVVPVGADGKVHLYTDAGTHLLVDLAGVFVSGVAVDAPSRVLDTRSGAKPKPGSVVVVPLGLSSGTKAVVLNVTATRATGPGYLTVWPDGPQPSASNLNIEFVDQTVPNLVIVPVGADGSIRVFTDAGTDLIVDVLGRLT